LVTWLVFLAFAVLGTRFGKPLTVTLLQYQAGIVYDRGVRRREVNGGRHRIWTRVEQIVVIDKRPISVSFENRAVTLADGSTAAYGFSGSAEVHDAGKALYSDQNYNNVPACVLLCCSRLVLNTYPSAQLTAKGEKIAQEIVEKARPRLRASGFDLRSFRLTQLSITSRIPQQGRPDTQ